MAWFCVREEKKDHRSKIRARGEINTGRIKKKQKHVYVSESAYTISHVGWGWHITIESFLAFSFGVKSGTFPYIFESSHYYFFLFRCFSFSSSFFPIYMFIYIFFFLVTIGCRQRWRAFFSRIWDGSSKMAFLASEKGLGGKIRVRGTFTPPTEMSFSSLSFPVQFLLEHVRMCTLHLFLSV